MEKRCLASTGCDRVFTYKSGSITEHFICYKDSNRVKNENSIFKLGSEGEVVKIIQKGLGFSERDCDGKFGPKTEQGVREFQKSNGMKEDGIVGPATLVRLNVKI